MTRKKIRYSELAPASPPAPVEAPAAPIAPDAAVRGAAPLALAKALAAARIAEEAARVLAAVPAVPATVVAPVAPAGPVVSVMVEAPRATPTPTPAPVPVAAAAAPGHSLRERARLRTGTVDLLVFGVGAEWFGVELAAVEEAIDIPPVRHVPEMPPAMLGVITVRGTITPLYSPATAFGIALTGGGSSLVFRRPRGRLAVAVDDVDDVHTLDLAQLRDAPAGDTLDGVLLGVLRYRDALLALVDAEALITACQTVPAMEPA